MSSLVYVQVICCVYGYVQVGMGSQVAGGCESSFQPTRRGLVFKFLSFMGNGQVIWVKSNADTDMRGTHFLGPIVVPMSKDDNFR